MADDLEAGQPEPPGATWDGRGVNFAVFAPRATRVVVCLFDAPGDARAGRRLVLPGRTGDVSHGFVPGLAPGQLYGLRVHAPHAPHRGLWSDPQRLLVDPFAQAVAGRLVLGSGLRTLDVPGAFDTAGLVPKAVVVDPAFDWQGDVRPATPWGRTVIAECHVRQYTARHEGVAPELRGTYLGLASAPVLAHFRALGVTAVELLPVVQHGPELHLLRAGRVNGWGYSPFAFLAPHGAYATSDRGAQVNEMKEMVRRFHATGLEIILDICLGHSLEGGKGGLTVSLKGLANPEYYRLEDSDASLWADDTGCGNMLDASQPAARRLVLDSLRHFAREYHVDGFRLDQAAVLQRGGDGPSLLDDIAADPLLASLKLIAEPWDLGPDGYRLGRFPAPFVEWNDRWREDVRAFWRGDGAASRGFRHRIEGSPDVFGQDRGPAAGANFVSCHDGFTLEDLLSFTRKHNEANGEDNRDGREGERGFGLGVRSEADPFGVRTRHERLARSLLATLAVSAGVPLLLQGDEMGRTQAGNTNAYCHEGLLVDVDWELGLAHAARQDFTRRALALRAATAGLRPVTFAAGRIWLGPDGVRAPGDGALAFIMLIKGAGTAPDEVAPLAVLFNASERRCRFQLPDAGARGGRWRELLHSGRDRLRVIHDGRTVVPAHGLVVLAVSVEAAVGPQVL